MFTFKRVVGLLSFAVLAVLLLSIGAAATVQAHNDKIKSTFAMNPLGPDDTVPSPGAIGSGEFELDGEKLNNLEFKLEVDATGLVPNTEYQISIQVRSDTGPPAGPADAIIVVGKAWTDAQGEFKAEGEGVIPNLKKLTPGATKWRIDQQVLQIGSGAGTPTDACVDCILVCRPTTRVMLNPTGHGVVLLGDDNSRPGNGFGDDNHGHSGPRGHDDD